MSEIPSREEALAIVQEYTENENLRKHMYAVEAAMRAYATELGEDEERWGITGLLHDFDYERWPDEHPQRTIAWLKERGEDAIARAADLLSKAKFPVILNGGGVVIGGAIEESIKLAERLDAPVCCGYQHNDAFPGSHPLFAGPLGYNGSKAGMQLISQADVVLALGTRLNPFSTLPGYGIDYWPKDAAIIQVDMNPNRIGLTKPVSVGIAGDAKKVATAILARLATSAGDEGRDVDPVKVVV